MIKLLHYLFITDFSSYIDNSLVLFLKSELSIACRHYRLRLNFCIIVDHLYIYFLHCDRQRLHFLCISAASAIIDNPLYIFISVKLPLLRSFPFLIFWQPLYQDLQNQFYRKPLHYFYEVTACIIRRKDRECSTGGWRERAYYPFKFLSGKASISIFTFCPSTILSTWVSLKLATTHF